MTCTTRSTRDAVPPRSPTSPGLHRMYVRDPSTHHKVWSEARIACAFTLLTSHQRVTDTEWSSATRTSHGATRAPDFTLSVTLPDVRSRASLASRRFFVLPLCTSCTLSNARGGSASRRIRLGPAPVSITILVAAHWVASTATVSTIC